MIFKLIRNQKGMLLPLVMILFAVIMIMSVTMLSLTMHNTTANRNYTSSVDALHFAEAGLNEYLWHLNKIASGAIDQNKDIAFGDGFYRVEVLGGSPSSGMITIKSTGYHSKNPDRSRSIEAVLTKRSFTQHVYLSNTETSLAGTVVWNTSIHTWNGPFHTNNTINISGSPTFNGRVTYVNSINLDNWSGPPNPVYNAGDPIKVTSIDFPESNSELKARALNGGHYYNGMTAIFLKGDEYDVRTYDSATNQWNYNNQAYSFNPSNGSNPKQSVASLKLPSNGVIYVDGSGSTQWRRRTGDLYISGEVDGKLTIASARNIYITGWDPTDWREPTSGGTNPARVPQGAFTGGIRYKTGTESTSLIGLIAEQNIEILNGSWPNHNNNQDNRDQKYSWSTDTAPLNIRMDGAYMALKGTIKYDHQSVNKGTATMHGAMIQNARGAFATGSNGYGRSFSHDPRLTYETPPYFLEPTNSGWEINEWRESSTPVPVVTP